MQAISLVVSGIMLGLKFGGILTLPALWSKMGKWRTTARPLRAAADLGIELRPASGQPDLTKEEYMEGFENLQHGLAEWAAKAVPAGLEHGFKMQAQLEKAAQKFSVLIHTIDAVQVVPPPWLACLRQCASGHCLGCATRLPLCMRVLVCGRRLAQILSSLPERRASLPTIPCHYEL